MRKAQAWPPPNDSQDPADQKLHAAISKTCRQINEQQLAISVAAWSEKKEEWARKCRVESPEPAGMDPAVEVGDDPRKDKRNFCPDCCLALAFNLDENARVRDAEDAAKKTKRQSKKVYNVNPLSHDDQHQVDLDGDSHPPYFAERHIFQGPLGGMHTYSVDTLTNARWDLFTHTGFHTWPHHDASGMSTWVRIRAGCKVWAPVIPDLPKTPVFTQHDLFDSVREVLRPAPSLGFQKHSQSLCMFLLPDDVLCVLDHLF